MSPGADVLVLYGERDQFTKKEKYQRWADDLRTAFNSVSAQPTTPNQGDSPASPDPTANSMAPDFVSGMAGSSTVPVPRLAIHVVPEADHFWRTIAGTIRSAREIVADWLDNKPLGVESALSPSADPSDSPEHCPSPTSAASSVVR